jgi:hypothetical protein
LTFDDIGEKPPNADGSALPKVPELSNQSSSSEHGNTHKSNRSSGSNSSELTETERKRMKLIDMTEIQTKFEENLSNIKKNIDQVFNATGSSSQDDDDSMKQGSKKEIKSRPSSDVGPTSAPAVVSDSEGPTNSAPETPQKGVKQLLTTSKTNNICGIKTTKRAIDDGYTITVCRRLLENNTKIIMTSKVEFDDPKKDAIEAKQIFERTER